MKRTSGQDRQAPHPFACRNVTIFAVIWFGLLMMAVRADAAELVMFESLTCEWCERFHAEVGPIYPKTPESACAPLRQVDVHDPRPKDLEGIQGVVFTPTFVLVERGEEIGRITGYPGDMFFWSLLADELKKLRPACILE